MTGSGICLLPFVLGKLSAGLCINALFLHLYIHCTHGSMFCVTGGFWWHCQSFLPWIWAAVFGQYHYIRGEADRLPDPCRHRCWLGDAELVIGCTLRAVFSLVVLFKSRVSGSTGLKRVA